MENHSAKKCCTLKLNKTMSRIIETTNKTANRISLLPKKMKIISETHTDYPANENISENIKAKKHCTFMIKEHGNKAWIVDNGSSTHIKIY